MVMNVRNESRLSMSQNRATIKALVIMLIHMTHQYSVNQPLNIQNEPSDYELFINKLIQQKLNENAQSFSAIAITLDLPTVEPEDSLRIGDEHLDTIPETKSDEFIKSSVENLVPNPSEPEDLSDNECDVPACDDFTTFSNLLFDVDDDFSSNPHHFNTESDLIESLLNHDSLIIYSSLKIDSLLDEFAGELILLKTIPPGIDETDCDPEKEIRLIEKLLYDNSSPRPPEEFISENSDVAIELSLHLLSPLRINDDYDPEVDMLILEELLSNDSLSLPKNESFHFDIPSSSHPPSKPPDYDSGILNVKVMGDISEHDVPMPRLLPTQTHPGFKSGEISSSLISSGP
nr:hypothetical protein [Tanacetum cinerariifolium]